MAFWPVIVSTPACDPSRQVIVPPASYAADTKTQTVTGAATVRDMTADEFLAANPVPQSVTNYQARAALVAAGLFAKVDAALRGADQSVAENQLALQAWDYANNFYRASPFIAALQGGLGLSGAQVDGLFRQAAQVS